MAGVAVATAVGNKLLNVFLMAFVDRAHTPASISPDSRACTEWGELWLADSATMLLMAGLLTQARLGWMAFAVLHWPAIAGCGLVAAATSISMLPVVAAGAVAFLLAPHLLTAAVLWKAWATAHPLLAATVCVLCAVRQLSDWTDWARTLFKKSISINIKVLGRLDMRDFRQWGTIGLRIVRIVVALAFMAMWACATSWFSGQRLHAVNAAWNTTLVLWLTLTCAVCVSTAFAVRWLTSGFGSVLWLTACVLRLKYIRNLCIEHAEKALQASFAGSAGAPQLEAAPALKTPFALKMLALAVPAVGTVTALVVKLHGLYELLKVANGKAREGLAEVLRVHKELLDALRSEYAGNTAGAVALEDALLEALLTLYKEAEARATEVLGQEVISQVLSYVGPALPHVDPFLKMLSLPPLSAVLAQLKDRNQVSIAPVVSTYLSIIIRFSRPVVANLQVDGITTGAESAIVDCTLRWTPSSLFRGHSPHSQRKGVKVLLPVVHVDAPEFIRASGPAELTSLQDLLHRNCGMQGSITACAQDLDLNRARTDITLPHFTTACTASLRGRLGDTVVATVTPFLVLLDTASNTVRLIQGERVVRHELISLQMPNAAAEVEAVVDGKVSLRLSLASPFRAPAGWRVAFRVEQEEAGGWLRQPVRGPALCSSASGELIRGLGEGPLVSVVRLRPATTYKLMVTAALQHIAAGRGADVHCPKVDPAVVEVTTPEATDLQALLAPLEAAFTVTATRTAEGAAVRITSITAAGAPPLPVVEGKRLVFLLEFPGMLRGTPCQLRGCTAADGVLEAREGLIVLPASLATAAVTFSITPGFAAAELVADSESAAMAPAPPPVWARAAWKAVTVPAYMTVGEAFIAAAAFTASAEPAEAMGTTVRVTATPKTQAPAGMELLFRVQQQEVGYLLNGALKPSEVTARAEVDGGHVAVGPVFQVSALAPGTSYNLVLTPGVRALADGTVTWAEAGRAITVRARTPSAPAAPQAMPTAASTAAQKSTALVPAEEPPVAASGAGSMPQPREAGLDALHAEDSKPEMAKAPADAKPNTSALQPPAVGFFAGLAGRVWGGRA